MKMHYFWDPVMDFVFEWIIPPFLIICILLCFVKLAGFAIECLR